MQSLEFSVLSSNSVDRYQATVERRGSEIVVFCKCNSGVQGKVCRHKSALLRGDYSRVLSGDFRTLEVWKEGTLAMSAIQEFDAAAEALAAAKVRKDKAEMRLAKLLRGH